jgi:NitT/TauT family transport system substrate-binding protein
MAACGNSGTASAGGTDDKKLDEVTLALYAVPSGIVAFFPYGVQEGIYQKHGIDLDVRYSVGSTAAAQQVAAGQVTFAETAGAPVLQTRAAGGDIKMFMGLTQKLADGVIVRSDSGIDSPADLKGRTIGIAKTSTSRLLFPAYLNKVGLSEPDVKQQSLSQSGLVPAFVAKKVDAVLTFPLALQPQLEEQGIATKAFLLADSGMEEVAYGLVAQDKTIRDDPDLVQRMVAATREALEASKQNPEAASKALVDDSEGAADPVPVTQKVLTAVFDYETTPNSAGHPLGWMSPEDWTSTLAIATKHLGLKGDVAIDDVYTNDFVSK